MSERTSIGEKRLEYLDSANKCLAAGDYGAAERNLNNFLATIREKGDISKKIQDTFDDLELKKNNTFKKICDETEKEELFIQTEHRSAGRDWVIAQNIVDRINSCWNVALEMGLFND